MSDLLSQLQASLVRCCAEKLDAIPRQVIKLTEWPGDPTCRPESVMLWAGMCEDTPPHITFYLPPMHGQQARYLDLEVDEARLLAHMLTVMTANIERIIPHVEPEPASGA